MGDYDCGSDIITINRDNLKGIETTISHEIEHCLLYRHCRKEGLTSEQAGFGCSFISNPSHGDKMDILNRTYHCEFCHKKLTSSEIENGFSLDGRNLICEECEDRIRVEKSLDD